MNCRRHAARFVCALVGSQAVTMGLGCQRRGEPVADLELKPRRLELGTLTQNAAVKSIVELRNRGTGLLRLRGTTTSSRCQWETPNSNLAAGARETRVVVCQSDLLGPLKEQLTVEVDEPSPLAVNLEVVGTVEPVVGFNTAFVDLRPEFGQTEFQDIRVTGMRAAETKLRVMSTGSDLVDVSSLPDNEGSPAGFRVTCKGDRVGMHAGSLTFETGLPEPATLTVSWGCRVPGTLEVSPSTPYFNLRVSGERATTVTVKSSQPGFVVTSARVVDGPFSAKVEKVLADGSYPITVKVLNRKIPDEARSATGTLVIQSNDAREPRKEIPLFGFGRINQVARPESS